MASSNRHWPSMFKSKPCNPHHQWQHDINSSLISTGCHRSPYTSGAGCEERSPEPKPRWNPKPEQIRILEAIFNSGMVNPPRDEIRKIRAQLQEYGQVGDANVFYWFQNRKSRSKHKLRHLQNSKNHNPETQQNPVSIPQITAPSSSSSSSEKSPPKEMIPTKVFSIGFSNVTDMVPNSPTNSVNQTYFQTQNETTLLSPAPPPATSAVAEAYFFPVQHHGHGVVLPSAVTSQGFCFSELSNVVQAQSHGQHNVGPCTSLLLSEIISHGAAASKKDLDQDKSLKIMHQPSQLNFCVSHTTTAPTTATVVPPITATTTTVPSPVIAHVLQGVGDPAVTPRSTVFINDMAFEVAVGPFNVREAFGDDAVLIHATGQPVLTNQWGITLQSLQHGACYYLRVSDFAVTWMEVMFGLERTIIQHIGVVVPCFVATSPTKDEGVR
ncbi:WUSCHEL-related homeobox 9-like [Abrus precatorius]|uniref:WUSCHEL-related homeobox 9-like n=1 Tax=Abrus precatorius TaxID=3816 RepID=A0A8B8K477_ABRPR|nr:WUSCHEL-related homeobox 9-like [Abrus precatorius]